MLNKTMKILILAVSLMLATSGCIEKPQQEEINLSNYPKLFEKDVIIIIGENARQTEIEGAQAIADKLGNLTGNVPVIKTTAEITEDDKSKNNLILVGNPGTNYLVQNIYALNQDIQTKAVNSYWEGTHKGSLLLFINPWVPFWNSPKYVLAVDGFDDEGTKSAVDVLLKEENIKKFYGTGVITKWEGVISWDNADTVAKMFAGSIALEFWDSTHQIYPEGRFSATNVTNQNGDWLVEIGTYDEILIDNETQPRLHGITGRVLVSKKTGKVKEVK